MPSSDADIKLTVDMEVDDADKALQNIRNDLRDLTRYANGKKLSNDFLGAVKSLQRLEKQATKVRDAMSDLAKAKANPQYAQLSTDFEKAQEKIEKLKAELKELQFVGLRTGNVDPKALDKLEAKIKYTELHADNLRNSMDILINNGHAFSDSIDTTKFLELRDQLRLITTEMTGVRFSAFQKAGEEIDTGPFSRLRDTIRNIRQELSITLTPLKTFLNSIKSIKNALGSVVSKLKEAFSGISNLPSLFSGATRNAGDLNSALNNGFKTFIKYGFAVRSFFFLFRKLRALVIEGLQEMGNAYPAFGQSINNFKAALETLKYTFVAAFAPIATTVIPVLVSLMNVIGGVITRISQLFAALTGQTKFIRAKAVSVTNDYAGSLGKTGKAAKAAKKALDELTIAGFDDVEILKEANDAASGSGSGGGGGAGGAGDEWADAFEEVNIDQSVWDIAEKIRALVAQQDWEGLGTFIGEQVNTMLDKIPWGAIGEKLGGFLDAIIQTLYYFLETLDFVKLGSGIAEFLNKAIGSINWEILGRLLVRGMTSIFDFVGGFVRDFDAKQIGEALHKFITGAFNEFKEWIASKNWPEIGETIANKVTDFFSGLHLGDVILALKHFFETAIPAAIDLLGSIGLTLWNKFKSWGKDAIEGFKNAWKEFDFWEWFTKENNGKSGGSNLVELGSGRKINPSASTGTGFAIESMGEWLQKIRKSLGSGGSGAVGGNVRNAFAKIFEKATTSGITAGAEKVSATPFEKLITATIDPTYTKATKTFNSLTDDTATKTISGSRTNVFNSVANSFKEIKNDLATKTIFGLTETAFTNTATAYKSVNDDTANKTITGSTGSTFTTVAGAFKSVIDNTVTKFIAGSQKGSFTDAKSAFNALKDKTSTFTAAGSTAKSFTDANKAMTNAASSKTATYTLKGEVKKSFTDTVSKLNSASKYTGFTLTAKKHGGAYFGGSWHNIPQYAGGTLNAGSMFIAGEAGPEIVGHVGSRTEVLNKSQLAMTMYTAVRDAMASAVNKLARYISMQMANSANGIISALNRYSLRQNIHSAIPQSTIDAVQSMAQTLAQVNATVARIPVPAMATGGVVPYSTTINTQSKLNDTLNAITDSLNTSSTNFTTDELYSILTDVIQRYMNVSFYIGDEQIARHANAGNLSISRRYRPTSNGK